MTRPRDGTDPLLRDYWVYEGSLTIPPCSEGVTWILFRYPLTISQLQVSAVLSNLPEWSSELKVKCCLYKREARLFYVLAPFGSVRSVTSFQIKVKCLEPVKAMERSRMKKTQLSFMICTLKVSFYRENRSQWNSQTFDYYSYSFMWVLPGIGEKKALGSKVRVPVISVSHMQAL